MTFQKQTNGAENILKTLKSKSLKVFFVCSFSFFVVYHLYFFLNLNRWAKSVNSRSRSKDAIPPPSPLKPVSELPQTASFDFLRLSLLTCHVPTFIHACAATVLQGQNEI